MSRKYKFKDNEKLDYIHKNPVESGIVLCEVDWLFSSAKWFYSIKKGMIEIIQIDPILVTW